MAKKKRAKPASPPAPKPPKGQGAPASTTPAASSPSSPSSPADAGTAADTAAISSPTEPTDSEGDEELVLDANVNVLHKGKMIEYPPGTLVKDTVLTDEQIQPLIAERSIRLRRRSEQ